jgi:transposase
MAETSCPNCVVLERRVAQLEAEVRRLIEQNALLTRRLEEALRSGKRQAAPFAKNPPKPEPKTPGRKSGDEHGTHGHRPPPDPKHIDEVHEARLPDCCPGCGGAVTETEIFDQFQTDIPRKPIYRKIHVHIGQCRSCGRRVQGRHRLQTSDALGAAAAQVGPEAQAAVVILNKDLGLSHGKVVRCLDTLFGIRLTRGASAQIVLRAGQRCEPAYRAIGKAARDSPWIVPDETGWRVGGLLAWLHVFVSPVATWFAIDRTRSGTVAETLLTEDYSGVLIHDGWSVYDRFEGARHQQCCAHLIRRADELIALAHGRGVLFPRAVQALLRDGLRLRDRYLDGLVGDLGLASARGRLWHRFVDLVAPTRSNPAHERFARFLRKHCADLFTFLEEPGLDATNWRAEQAIRPAVVNRKVWGGNRTWIGAKAQAVLTSVLATCRQLRRDSLDFLSHAFRSRTPRLLIPAA